MHVNLNAPWMLATQGSKSCSSVLDPQEGANPFWGMKTFKKVLHEKRLILYLFFFYFHQISFVVRALVLDSLVFWYDGWWPMSFFTCIPYSQNIHTPPVIFFTVFDIRVSRHLAWLIAARWSEANKNIWHVLERVPALFFDDASALGLLNLPDSSVQSDRQSSPATYKRHMQKKGGGNCNV